MLLNVAKHILHVVSIHIAGMVETLAVSIVIGARSVTVTGGWKLHVHVFR